MASQAKTNVIDPLIDNNPITLQVLGICSALAVTTNMTAALIMCIALTTVAAFSGAIISMIRNRFGKDIYPRNRKSQTETITQYA